ncbi:unnamed protein product [Symbiodinium necroappetens]|uniref:Uncharacterized protein n=1 Tax=Symbiodinium necroappetens TaxID=1628268 RepID=A0A812PHT6_9DINO|nr:unnamed protein product [Symbiodinium necroappetens]
MKDYCCHPFWAAVDAQMPDDLVQVLKDYTDKAFRFCHLVEYVFASRNILPALEQTYPTPEMLRHWSQELVPSLKPYVDSKELLQECEGVFATAAAEDLQKQTMSCFEEVGKITSKVHATVLTNVEVLVSSMSPALAFESQAKLTLPQTGDWSHVLTRFFEVGKACSNCTKKNLTLMEHVAILQSLQDLRDAMEEEKKSKCEKLKATQLVSEEAFVWVDRAVGLMAIKVNSLCNDHAGCLDTAIRAASGLALKIPEFKQEGHYRETIGKLSQKMASDAKKLSLMASEFRSASLSLPPCAERDGYLQKAKIAAGVSQLLTTHVTLFACVTMLRNPALNTKSEAAKKAAKQLENLVFTLLSQDLRATPPCDALADTALVNLWDEARDAVKAVTNKFGVDVEKLWQETVGIRSSLPPLRDSDLESLRREPAMATGASDATPTANQSDQQGQAAPEAKNQAPSEAGTAEQVVDVVETANSIATPAEAGTATARATEGISAAVPAEKEDLNAEAAPAAAPAEKEDLNTEAAPAAAPAEKEALKAEAAPAAAPAGNEDFKAEAAPAAAPAGNEDFKAEAAEQDERGAVATDKNEGGDSDSDVLVQMDPAAAARKDTNAANANPEPESNPERKRKVDTTQGSMAPDQKFGGKKPKTTPTEAKPELEKESKSEDKKTEKKEKKEKKQDKKDKGDKEGKREKKDKSKDKSKEKSEKKEDKKQEKKADKNDKISKKEKKEKVDRPVASNSAASSSGRRPAEATLGLAAKFARGPLDESIGFAQLFGITKKNPIERKPIEEPKEDNDDKSEAGASEMDAVSDVGADEPAQPVCIFRNILDMASAEAECVVHKKKCPIPTVDILVVGTSCKDMSRINNAAPKSAVLRMEASKGGSAQTFQGLLGLLDTRPPAIVLFENVDTIDDNKDGGESNLDIFKAETSSRGYDAQVVMTDAYEFGLSATCATDMWLPADDPAVLRELETREEKRASERVLMQDLAGNAMALPVVLAMLQCAFGALSWRATGSVAQDLQAALVAMEELTNQKPEPANQTSARRGPPPDEDYARRCGGFVIASAEWNSLGWTTRSSLRAMLLCRSLQGRRFATRLPQLPE